MWIHRNVAGRHGVCRNVVAELRLLSADGFWPYGWIMRQRRLVVGCVRTGTRRQTMHAGAAASLNTDGTSLSPTEKVVARGMKSEGGEVEAGAFYDFTDPSSDLTKETSDRRKWVFDYV